MRRPEPSGSLRDPTSSLPRALATAVLVTGNRDKLVEARRLCGAELGALELDLPEIQSLDLIEVLRHKAVIAASQVAGPFVVEETGLELAALNGFPGPLVKWMLAAMGAERIAQIADRLGDDRATARCCLLYQNGDTTVIGEGSTSGRLVLPARGEQGFGWDPVFVPDGESRTYAELEPTLKDRLSHRGGAWRDLLRQLSGTDP